MHQVLITRAESWYEWRCFVRLAWSTMKAPYNQQEVFKGIQISLVIPDMCPFLLRIYYTISITTASHGEAILARQELHSWCNILKVCFYGSCKVLIQSYTKCMPAQCFQHSHCGFLSRCLQTMNNDLLNRESYILKFKPCYPNLILKNNLGSYFLHDLATQSSLSLGKLKGYWSNHNISSAQNMSSYPLVGNNYKY